MLWFKKRKSLKERVKELEERIGKEKWQTSIYHSILSDFAFSGHMEKIDNSIEARVEGLTTTLNLILNHLGLEVKKTTTEKLPRLVKKKK